MLRFEAFLPDGFDTVAEVVENVAALNTASSRKESADNSGDVTADVELLWVFDTNAFHTETKTTNTWKDNGLTFT